MPSHCPVRRSRSRASPVAGSTGRDTGPEALGQPGHLLDLPGRPAVPAPEVGDHLAGHGQHGAEERVLHREARGRGDGRVVVADPAHLLDQPQVAVVLLVGGTLATRRRRGPGRAAVRAAGRTGRTTREYGASQRGELSIPDSHPWWIVTRPTRSGSRCWPATGARRSSRGQDRSRNSPRRAARSAGRPAGGLQDPCHRDRVHGRLADPEVVRGSSRRVGGELRRSPSGRAPGSTGRRVRREDDVRQHAVAPLGPRAGCRARGRARAHAHRRQADRDERRRPSSTCAGRAPARPSSCARRRCCAAPPRLDRRGRARRHRPGRTGATGDPRLSPSPRRWSAPR